MEGKITFYNENSGKGKILTRDERVFSFIVDVWRDFDVMPRVGVLVEFEIDSAQRVTKLLSKKTPKNQQQSIQEQDSKGLRDKKVPQIAATKPLKRCLDEYYNDIYMVIDGYGTVDENEKELNFIKLKRFLFTAYNDLYELDSALTDSEMDAVKSELQQLQKEYETFRIKSSYPLEYLYEKIFLSKQTEYMKLQNDLELTLSKIKSFSLKERPLLDKMKQKELELLALENNKKGEEYTKVSDQLKYIKKRYVDLLHEVALLRELQEKLRIATQEFKESYLEEFLKEERSLSRYLDSKLLKILNIKAYKFDTTMWERAKKSKLIRQFFMDAGIEGTYSSRTFLKYYLRTLDKEKLSPENKELFELQKYLESMGNETVLIIRNSADKAVKTKYLVEGIDKELKVNAIYDPMESFRICLKEKPDIILFDFSMRTINGIEYLKRFKEVCPNNESDTTFCVLLNEDEKEHIKELKKLGVRHFLSASWGDYEFVDFMRTVL